MTTKGVCSCGRESSSPMFDVAPLADSEDVVWVVRSRELLRREGRGKVGLSPTAFRREDVEGKRGKSVSLLRPTLADVGEMAERAASLTFETIWKEDPVIALARASDLRTVDSSTFFPKCACLYADPITEEQAEIYGDPLGATCYHASLKRHCSFSASNNDPKAWVNLISDLAECFDRVVHVHNQQVLTEI